mgnify:CR=1 FL=1
MTRGWLEAWWRHFGAGKRLLIAQHGRSFAPFHFQRHGPFRVGYILGTGPVATRGMGLADRADLFVGEPFPAELADALAAEAWDLLWLRALPGEGGRREEGGGRREEAAAESRFTTHVSRIEGFAEAARRQGWGVDIRPRSVSPYLTLPATWDDYLRSRTASERYDYRNHRRQLEKAGELQVELISGATDGAALLAELAEVEAASWKAAAGTALLLQPGLRPFFDEVVRDLLLAGQMAIATLRLNGQMLAGMLCFSGSGVFSTYNVAYRQGARPFSPGTVLLLDSIERLIAQGYREVDFMRGEEEYKTRWASGQRAEVDWIVTRPTARARLAAAVLVDGRERLKNSPAVVRLRDAVLRRKRRR